MENKPESACVTPIYYISKYKTCLQMNVHKEQNKLIYVVKISLETSCILWKTLCEQTLRHQLVSFSQVDHLVNTPHIYLCCKSHFIRKIISIINGLQFCTCDFRHPTWTCMALYFTTWFYIRDFTDFSTSLSVSSCSSGGRSLHLQLQYYSNIF